MELKTLEKELCVECACVCVLTCLCEYIIFHHSNIVKIANIRITRKKEMISHITD